MKKAEHFKGGVRQVSQRLPHRSRRRRATRPYLVVWHGHALGERFASVYEAYMHALNRFCSEDFLVEKEGG